MLSQIVNYSPIWVKSQCEGLIKLFPKGQTGHFTCARVIWDPVKLMKIYFASETPRTLLHAQYSLLGN